MQQGEVQSATPPPILHLTLLHPLDDHYGLAPLEAPRVAVDTHNAAASWNKALLDNAARPSRALGVAGADRTVMAGGPVARPQRQLAVSYPGAPHPGRPLPPEGGLDW